MVSAVLLKLVLTSLVFSTLAEADKSTIAVDADGAPSVSREVTHETSSMAEVVVDSAGRTQRSVRSEPQRSTALEQSSEGEDADGFDQADVLEERAVRSAFPIPLGGAATTRLELPFGVARLGVWHLFLIAFCGTVAVGLLVMLSFVFLRDDVMMLPESPFRQTCGGQKGAGQQRSKGSKGKGSKGSMQQKQKGGQYKGGQTLDAASQDPGLRSVASNMEASSQLSGEASYDWSWDAAGWDASNDYWGEDEGELASESYGWGRRGVLPHPKIDE